MPDIRGHGLSGGERGDAPSLQQIYDDVTLMIGTAHNEFPSLPVFLGGHSAGAGLIVNYINSPGHEFVNGYLFVAPDFGLKSNTIYEDNGHFATVCQKAYIAHALTFGLLKGHAIGVKYNYSEEQMESDIGLVQYNSVIMSLALNPGKPSEEVARIDRPFGLWVGAGDESWTEQGCKICGSGQAGQGRVDRPDCSWRKAPDDSGGYGQSDRTLGTEISC